MITYIVEAQVLNRFKFADQGIRERPGRGFAHVNGVLAFAVGVTGPKIELISGCGRTLVIDERSPAHARFGFRKKKRNFTRQSVVVGDDEDRLAIGEQILSSFPSGLGNFAPVADAIERIE